MKHIIIVASALSVIAFSVGAKGIGGGNFDNPNVFTKLDNISWIENLNTNLQKFY